MRPTKSNIDIMTRKRLHAFTLAELMIVVLILGQIATFTIPKLITSQQNSKKKAVFRETYSTLSEMLNVGRMTGEIVWDGPEWNTLAFKRLNHVKACPTNSESEGCWAPASATCNSSYDEPGMRLHNGATVVGFDTDASSVGDYSDSFGIDWNGLEGPNIEGDDQLCLSAYLNVGGSRAPGTIRSSSSTASTDLFAEIFGQ